MGTTTHGLPYPEPTDPVAAGAAAIRSLAESLDPVWLALPLGPGWVNWGGIYLNAGYMKMGGIVFLRGLINAGAAGNVATLPVGFRPPGSVQQLASAGGSFVSLTINAAGLVSVTGTLGPNLSLEGVFFSAAP